MSSADETGSKPPSTSLRAFSSTLLVDGEKDCGSSAGETLVVEKLKKIIVDFSGIKALDSFGVKFQTFYHFVKDFVSLFWS